MEIKTDNDLLIEQAEVVSNLLKEMSKIKDEKATAIIFIKSGVKTWKEAEYLWSATSTGKREIELDYILKGLKGKMSALRNRIYSNRAY